MKRLIAIALALSATTAYAKQEYAAYEGLDAIQQGRGGSKITKNGIDYWTNGTPPRRFQVLGFLTDARKDRAFDGNVVGSKSVAEKALKAGGDAVVFLGADTRAAGVVGTANVYGQGNMAFGNSFGRVVNRTTTQMLVIKYLAD